jgi:transcriptional regulator with XRE-family HTH domain
MTKWEQLIAAREHLHLSQAEAAERINVGLVTYQRWEVGRRKPQPQHIRQLYAVFGTALHPFTEEARQPQRNGVEPFLQGEFASFHDEDIDEPQTFIAANMTAHLWSLAFMDHPTCQDKRYSIKQAIKEFTTMNTDKKNYQITRREALYSLATLPMITLGLTVPGSTVQPAQYGATIAHCSASIEACWELYKSGDAKDLTLAFQSVSKYLPILEMIAKQSSPYRKEALDLATQYALVKVFLGWERTNPTETVQYAKQAVSLSQETDDIALQLSAYSKLAWTYYYDKKYLPALMTAQEAQARLQNYTRRTKQSLHPGVQGGTYSTLALMQAKNGESPDDALGKATEADPGTEIYAFMDFKRSNLLFETGLTYFCQGDQAKVMETLRKRVDPETLTATMPQSERGHIETISIMALASLKMPQRDMERTIHFWTASITGAKTLQSEQIFAGALTAYEIMEFVWPNEKRITDLRGHIVHWE